MAAEGTISQRIASRTATVSVAGLGYVGLPLAIAFAEAGFEVHGIDVDPERLRMINAGQSYLEDVPSATVGKLVLDERRLRATDDYDVVADSDAAIICVPTPLSKTRTPDVSHIALATESIAARMHEEMLVVLESTSYPGSTEDLVLARLLANSPNDLQVGKDFFLAFSPERVDPGQRKWTIANTPKVIGGATPACTEVASQLYGAIVESIVPVSSPRTAEMVKLLENTFRATNIALANEMAIMCERLGVDVWEVIDAAGTKPFGYMPFYPGPGLGGHCIPVDPQYLAWKMRTLDYTARFIQLAEEINFSMPQYVADRVADSLNSEGKALNGSKILILGVAYKRDVSDTRESPALDLIHLLRQKGASVTYHDPLVPAVEFDGLELTSVGTAGQPSLDEATAASDCVVIVTDHSSYDWDSIAQSSRMIVDTRNAIGGRAMPSGRLFKL